MRTRIIQAVAEHRLFREGDTVIVAVSGGADSVALLDILAGLHDLHLRLIVAHLNHALRGPEADGDEAFVRRLAVSYGLPAEVARVDVRELGRVKKLSLEEAGRVARYAFFDDVACRYGAAAIALGHHADDQAETVLMRLLRGAGGTGLCGISAKSFGKLVRPLLGATRRDIEEYIRQRGLSCRHDSTNSATDFLRNRVRLELLPYLATYNPAVSGRLVAAAEALARDEEVMEGITDAAFARHGRDGHGRVTIQVAGCAAEQAGVRFRLYRRAVLLVKGGLERIAAAHLRAIDTMVFARKPQMVLSLPDGLRVSKSYAELCFFPAAVENRTAPCETTADGPGVYILPGGYSLVIEECPPPEAWGGLSPATACFDADAAPFPWLVRTFRAGDRLVPLGMTGHKKVKDLFIDEKVPLRERRRIPLVFSGERLIWAGTLRTSAEVCITGRTRKAVRAEILDMDSLMDL